MSGTVDPGADPRLRFDEPTRCRCGGTGVATDAADAGDGWWLVTWRTEHRRGCPGVDVPERAFLISVAAADAGDYTLPGVEPEHLRRRRPMTAADLLARYPPPIPEHQCAAWAWTVGRRCRREAGPDGLCGTHRRQA